MTVYTAEFEDGTRTTIRSTSPTEAFREARGEEGEHGQVVLVHGPSAI